MRLNDSCSNLVTLNDLCLIAKTLSSVFGDIYCFRSGNSGWLFVKYEDVVPPFNVFVVFELSKSPNVQKHSVWKSSNKSHFTLRAKRTTFTFWVDKNWLKKQKNCKLFWRVFENLKLVVKQRYQIGHFNATKITQKCRNWLFWHLKSIFVLSKCKRSSLRSQY